MTRKSQTDLFAAHAREARRSDVRKYGSAEIGTLKGIGIAGVKPGGYKTGRRIE
jgi:hypothetical protein